MRKIIFILGTILLLGGCKSSQPLTSEQQLEKQVVEEMLTSKDYTVEFDRVVTQRGKGIFISSGYDLSIKNDSVFAYLPYFGRSFSAPLGGNGGVKFQEPYTDYQMQEKSKGDGYEIRMKARDLNDQYQLFLTVYNDGSSVLTINFPQRDSITYYGELKSS